MLGIVVFANLAVNVLGQIASSSALPETGGGSTASAGELAALPACAQICLGNSTTNQGNCSSEDIKCLCQNDNYVNGISCCLATQCNSNDQESAANFNTDLCTSVNITLPNFLGCANGSSPSSTHIGGFTTSRTATVGNGTKISATSVVGTLESQLSLITTAAVATFTGGEILTGSCSQPQFASMTLPTGGILEYPWLGCSEEDPGCCPFNIKTGGKLSICPADYTTTSSACCPSGWSIYTSALAGETPCVSSPSLPLTPPTTIAPPGVSASAITNEIFTFKYALVARPSKNPSPGAIAGIAISSVSAIALILAAATLIIRRRHAKARAEHEAATSSQSETAVKGRSELDPSSTQDTEAVAELPSPQSNDTKGTSELPGPSSPKLPERPVWSFRLPTSPSELANKEVYEMPASPPAEMAGSTYMDEHHPLGHSLAPLRKGSGSAEKRQGMIMGKGGRDVDGEEVSPVSLEDEEAIPAYTPTSGKMLEPADEPYVGSDV